MPLCVRRKQRPALDKGGLQGGVQRGNKPTPALRATPPKEGIFRKKP
jgi:hypothetical protein